MEKFSLRTVCLVCLFCAATVVELPAQMLNTLVNFNMGNGASPGYGSLIQASDGNFYGTTLGGGANNNNSGTVFRMTPDGMLSTLYSFCPLTGCADGEIPVGGLVQGTDGNLYGTTELGGSNNGGTVFRISLGGGLTTIHSFCQNGGGCTDGQYPLATLILGADGNFYGTTVAGGTNEFGTVFKITPTGTPTVLHSFSGSDGSMPNGLVRATDGNFYGTTLTGIGSAASGTFFQMTPGGKLNTLYNFCSQPNCTDGGDPSSALTQGTDGNFYGTATIGGNNSAGTVFKITSSGTLTPMYSFCSQSNCADGTTPFAGLVQASDGNFYGTTQYGGNTTCHNGCGTVFKITPGGKLTTLHLFDGSDDGNDVTAGLIQASDGNFYGTTSSGGAGSWGTVYRLSVGPTALQFLAATPCRLVDTRTADGGNGPIQGGTIETFNLPQLASGNPGCPNLSSAAAYSLNVTVVPEEGKLDYLTIWPAGLPQPLVSTVNSYDGRIKAVAAIVPAGNSQAVSVYVTNTTDLLLDIDGYFATPSGSTLQFYPLPPCRVADTRDSTDYAPGLGAPYLMGNTQHDFPVLNAAMNKVPCVIPNSAQAYSMNFTAVPHGPLGYLTVWPTGENQPVVSTLNSYGGQVTANAAIVPAGTAGDVNAFVTNDTDLLIDINGYFASPGTGGLSLYPVVPCRVIDTRTASGGNGPFSGVLSPPVDPVNSPCAVPAASQADVFNATVVPTGALGYLTLWPYCQTFQQPVVSTLNAYDGVVTSNMAIVPAGTQGMINAYSDQSTAPTDLILDISSYFAP